MKVSVVIPTVAGREDSLDRCLDAYRRTIPDGWSAEFIVVRDRPSCGEAWNEGADVATGDLLHVTADDLEPHDGWIDAAYASLQSGWVPSPVLELPWGGTDGEVGAHESPAKMTPVFFTWLRDWPGCPPIHYWSDFAVSFRLMAGGHRIAWCHGYRFTHHRVGDAARTRMERRYAADQAAFLNDVATYKTRGFVCASL